MTDDFNWVAWANLGTTVLIFFQVLVAVVSLLWYHRDQNKRATLEFWETIEKELKAIKRELAPLGDVAITPETAKHIEETPELRVKARRVCNYFNRFCIGIEMGVYNFDVANEVAGKLIVDNYKRYSAYIHHRRSPGHDKPSLEAWRQWERVAERMAKRRQISLKSG